MSKKINYEKEVKTRFANAIRVGVGVSNSGPLLHMISGCGLGENYHKTPYLAWKNAYEKLVHVSPLIQQP